MNADEFVVDGRYRHDNDLELDPYVYLGRLRVDLDTDNERDQLVFRDATVRECITVYELEDAWEFKPWSEDA
jgi:hypothetical protein